ncbi:hypothetical protein FC83_GL000201 [Agrilactobacillus composti DSM 18527 = JCM 14202]|uniref:Uncharacterized protein n=1 Tax=Agrilactobacillus composti DSM 18527 = JCM 14202 TaxID=1423734 RepID=X0QPR6_9LACO|nr:hypothetical protein [Agrilactobacillus composti]KRM32800.1 hypothetical protein FC83_GL000201 [Agrilactobacillus composti DSM 18527 = JCM 14202]GAF40605.1 hypothetical protein JCM14202_2509 [Agrilactobacillus composti DSM 18527 = JCM 14202]
MEQSLLEILQDLIDAQNHGQSAADYFGHEPAVTAKALLDAIPRQPGTFILFNLKLFIFMLLIMSIPDLVRPNAPIDYGRILIISVAAILLAWVVLWVFGTLAFIKFKRPQKIGLGIGAGLLYAALIGGSIFIRTPFKTRLPELGILIGLFILLLIGIALLIRLRKRDLGTKLLIGWLLFYVVLGIATRLPGISTILNQPVNFGNYKWLLYVAMVLAAIIGGGGTWWYLRRHSD